jgi:hypothetical protein
MVTTIEGVYRQGRVELAEQPTGIKESRVLVTFLPETGNPAGSRQEIVERIIARAAGGLDLGGAPYPKREDLYDRGRRRE